MEATLGNLQPPSQLFVCIFPPAHPTALPLPLPLPLSLPNEFLDQLRLVCTCYMGACVCVCVWIACGWRQDGDVIGSGRQSDASRTYFGCEPVRLTIVEKTTHCLWIFGPSQFLFVLVCHCPEVILLVIQKCLVRCGRWVYDIVQAFNGLTRPHLEWWYTSF